MCQRCPALRAENLALKEKLEYLQDMDGGRKYKIDRLKEKNRAYKAVITDQINVSEDLKGELKSVKATLAEFKK